MTPPKPSQRRRKAGPDPADFWRAKPEPPPVPDVDPASDPTALLRSLGPPPLPGVPDADRALAAVAHRAAGLATVLASVADILSDDSDDSDEGDDSDDGIEDAPSG